MRRIARIGEFCATGTGGTPPRDQAERYFEGGTIPWVKSGELRESIVTATEEHVTEAALKETNVKILPPGTLLLAMYGATVGRLGILGVQATTNQAVCHIMPDREVAETRYLFHSLRAHVPTLLARRVGGAQPNISQGIVREVEILLPPLPEQRRIADVLDRAEALRAKRRAALAQLDSLTQSLFLNLFGDPATNPKGWPAKTLGELIIEGPQNGLYKPATDYGSGTPILRIDAFYDGVVTDVTSLKRVRVTEVERKHFRISAGDVVINRVNSLEYLGKCALIPELPEKTVFESNMMRMRFNPSTTTPEFIVQYLQTGFVKSQIHRRAKHAVNQASINQQDVRGFHVNLPPVSLQQEFARRVSAVEALKTAHRAALAELDALFASLQHRAFRGEL